MEDLRCTTSNCEHNIRKHCTAGIINVSQTATCHTKIKREGSVLAQQFAEMEAASEMGNIEKESVFVQCDATCKYNENHTCMAEGITVADSFFSTKCMTREKP